MDRRVLITADQDEIAPRFDLTREVVVLSLAENGEVVSRKTLLLAHASADELCDLALSRDIGTIVCGGIEEEYYHYLRWKRIDVIDAVMGPLDRVVARLASGGLKAGDILYDRNAAP